MTRKPKPIQFDLSAAPLEVLPHSDSLEAMALAVLIQYPDAYSFGLRLLRAPGLFYNPDHQSVWDMIQDVVNNGGTPDLPTLVGRFQGARKPVLVTLCKAMFGRQVLHNKFHHTCLRLNEYWIQRSIHQTGYYLNQYALAPDVDALQLLGEASEKIGGIFGHIAAMKEKTLADGITELADELEAIRNSKDGMQGIPGSIRGLNQVTKGYRNGALTILAASTHEGKTTLAIQEMKFLAKQGRTVGYISLEMAQKELLLLMACDDLGIDTGDALGGQLSANDYDRIRIHTRMMQNLPMHITDKPGMRVGEVKALARAWKKQHGLEILFIDHLHLMYDDKDHSNAEQQFTSIANKLKELAKELEIPVVSLAQLSRKDKGEKGRPHVVEDLKYASGIEQAADVILLIYRPEMHGHEIGPNGESTAGYAKIIVAKLRLLKKYDVKCHFTGLRFVDMDEWQAGYHRLESSWQGKASAGITPNYLPPTIAQSALPSPNTKPYNYGEDAPF